MKTLCLFLFLSLLPLFVVSQTASYNVQSQFEEAQRLHRQGECAASIQLCEAILSKPNNNNSHPFRVEVLFKSTEGLHCLYRNDEALTHLLEAKSILDKKEKKGGLRTLKLLNLMAKTYFRLDDCENMKSSLKKALALFEGKTTDNELAETYDYWGNYWGEMGDFKRANVFFEKGLAIRQHNAETDPFPCHRSYLFLAVTASHFGDYDHSIALMQEGLTIIEEQKGSYLDKSKALLQLGIIYNGKGDFNTAIQYCTEGIALLEGHPLESIHLMLSHYRAMGMSYRQKGIFDKSEYFYQKALNALGSSTDLFLFHQAAVHHDYAILLSDLGDSHRADSLLNLSFQSYQALNQGCNWYALQMNQTQSTRAILLYNMGKYEEAIGVYHQAIRQITTDLGPRSPYLPQALNNIGLTFYALSQYDSAAIYYDRALAILDHNNDGELDFSNVVSPIEYSYLIWNKAENLQWKYVDTGDRESLEDALHYFQVYVRFLDYLRHSYRSEATKTGFAAENKIAYEKCLEVIAELESIDPNKNRMRSTFSYLEKSKAMILLEASKRSQAIGTGALPPTIVVEEDSLGQAARNAEARYFNYLGRLGEADKETKMAKSHLFARRRDFDLFLDRLKIDHPDYYQFKYAPDITPLEKVQQELLNEGECMVQYYEGESNIYLFFIGKKDYQMVKVKRDFPLTDWVLQFRTGIQGYHTLGQSQRTDKLYRENLERYITAAQNLHEKLVAPLSTFTEGYEKLIMVPDGQLANLPFEALLSGRPKSTANFSSYPFLLRKKVISYCYSATMLQEMEQRKHRHQPANKLLALAPFAAPVPMAEATLRSNGKGTLPSSGEEAIAVSDIWNGEHVLGQKATKDYFTATCPDYAILHISTHGFADAKDGMRSYLAFKSQIEAEDNLGKLSVREINDLRLNSDMVVLSACETNIGELQVGEGIISLARAFAYAGAKSILTTLWQVDDAATKDLTKQFYIELKKGKRKDEALRAAKIWHLENNENSGKHPFFWAAMIPVGDMSAME